MIEHPNPNRASTSAAPATAVEDCALLRRYVKEKSEAAFAELVRRRIGLVYSVALRQTRGDRHRAEDATQAVFTDLARKAATLAQRPVLAGWLYRSAQYAAAGLIRAEQRRHAREHEAHLMQTTLAPDQPPADWDKVRPMLDQALNEIDESDRDAILLRYFDGRPFAEIGAQLRLTENAARMRVERALDKLNAALARRGISSTAAALAGALGHQIATAAPAGLAATVTGAALAHTAAATTTSVVAILTMTKTQIGIAGAAALAGAAGFAMQAKTNSSLQREIAALRPPPHAAAALRVENQRLASVAAEVETLQRDDRELQQLEQSVAEARRAIAARKAGNDDAQRERIRAADRAAQDEVDRLNREGNALVSEYKILNARANDPALTPAERERASAAAKQKLAEIQAKQREIKAFIERTRHVLQQAAQGLGPPLPAMSYAARNQSETSARAALTLRQPLSPDARVSLRLPGADPQTALAAYEVYAGTKIVRDPSLAQARGTIDLALELVTAAEAKQAVEAALREKLNIVIEPGPDGTLVARTGPPR